MMQNLIQIKKAKQGNAAAFAELYRTIYPELYRFALYTLKNPSDAEDAVSETVMDAFAGISKLRSEAAFRGWIFRILSNKCKSCLRKRYRLTAELKEELPDMAIEEKLDENLWVRNHFYELDDDARLIISMHIFAGYTSREIGRILHMNENTVRSKENRALKKLASKMEKER